MPKWLTPPVIKPPPKNMKFGGGMPGPPAKIGGGSKPRGGIKPSKISTGIIRPEVGVFGPKLKKGIIPTVTGSKFKKSLIPRAKPLGVSMNKPITPQRTKVTPTLRPTGKKK